jgi:uncharacterized membrane protein YdbT with pleckstrin-like domain
MFSIITTVITAIIQIISNLFTTAMESNMFSIIIVVLFVILAVREVKNALIKNALKKSTLRLREFYRLELMEEKEVLATLEAKLVDIQFKANCGRTDVKNAWTMQAKVADQKEVVKGLRRKIENIDSGL